MGLLEDLQRAVAEISVNSNGVPPTHRMVGAELPSIDTQPVTDSLFMLATYCMHLYLKIEHIHERTKDIGPTTVSPEVASAAMTEFMVTNQIGITWRDRALWLEQRLLTIANDAHDRQYLRTVLRATGVPDSELDAKVQQALDALATPSPLPPPTSDLAWGNRAQG